MAVVPISSPRERRVGAEYEGRSLAALGVAAHEAGHAIQHARACGPLKFRSLLVRPASIGSNVGVILASVGLALQASSLRVRPRC
jgi:Zn-dependent membrane protease YugP